MPAVPDVIGVDPRDWLSDPGGPRDDAAYREWRDGFLERAADRVVGDPRWDGRDPGLAPAALDAYLFEHLSSGRAAATEWRKRLRFLAVTLRLRPSDVGTLAAAWLEGVIDDARRPE